MFYKEIHSNPDFADLIHHLQGLTTANQYVTWAQNMLVSSINGIMYNIDSDEDRPYTRQIKATTIELEKAALHLREAADLLEALKATAYNPYPGKDQEQ